MSSTVIEERVVGLKFDNKDFEKNTRKSMTTLEQLERSIAGLKGAGATVSMFAAHLKANTWDPFARGAEMSINKVLALTAAITGVSNIVTQLQNTFTRFLREVSFGQIEVGFNKYETYTDSIQTIMSATKKDGEDSEVAMKRVNDQMERLLWFTDETSYNLTDMTSNVGKFTSQGLGLEESVTAMQGIALWAAAAGQKSAEASRVMYNMSQAMGSGKIQLKDWMSVENANMATKEFKELAIEAGLAQGTLKKVGDEIQTLEGTTVTIAKFRDTLQDDWLTTDTFMKVATQYGEYAELVRKEVEKTGKQASEVIKEFEENGTAAMYKIGSAALAAGQEAKTFSDAIGSVKDAVSTQFLRIFQSLFGNYLQAKELWTDLANEMWTVFAGPLSDAADLLEAWNEKGGPTKIIEQFFKTWESIYNLAQKAKEVFNEVFTTFNTEKSGLKFLDQVRLKIRDITLAVRLMIDKIIANQNIWNNVKTFLTGIQSVLNIVKKAITSLSSRVLVPLFKRTESFAETGSGFLAMIGHWLTQFEKYLDRINAFDKIFDALYTLITTLIESFKQLGNTISRSLKNSPIAKEIKNIVEEVDTVEKTSDGIVTVIDLIVLAIQHITNAINFAIPLIIKFWEWLRRMIGALAVFFTKSKEFIAELLKKIGLDFEKLSKSLSDTLNEFFDSINLLDTLKNSNGFFDFINKLKDNIFKFFDTKRQMKEELSDTGDVTLYDRFLTKFVGAIEKFLDKFEPLVPRIKDIQDQLFGGESLITILEHFLAMLLIVAGFVYAIVERQQKIKMAATGGAGTGGDFSFISIFQFALSGRKFNALMDWLLSLRDPLSKIISMFNSFLKKVSIAAIIFAVGTVITSLAKAMLMISILPLDKMIYSAIVIHALAGIVVLIMLATEKIAEKAKDNKHILPSISLFMVAFGAAILQMAIALMLISNVVENSTEEGGKSTTFAFILMVSTIAGLAIGLLKIADAFQSGTQIMAAGAAVFFIAKAVEVAAKSVGRLAKVEKQENLALAMVIVESLMASLAVIMGLATFATKVQGIGKTIVTLGLSTLFISGAVGLMCISLIKISDIPLDSLKASATALGVIYLIISTFLAGATAVANWLSNNKKAFAGIAGVVVLMGTITAVMSAMGKTIATIFEALPEGYKWGDVLAVAGGIAAIVGAMAAAMIVVSQFEKTNIGSMFALAGAMGVLGLAVLEMSYGFENFNKIGWDTVFKGIVAIGALIAIMVIASQFVKNGYVIAGIAILAGALLVLGAAIAFVGSTIDAVARVIEAYTKLSEISTEGAENIRKASAVFVEIIPALAVQIGNGVEQIISNLFGYDSKITDAIVLFGKALLEKSKDLIPKFKEFIEKVVTEVATFIRDNHEKIFETVSTVFSNVVSLLINLLTTYAPEFITWLVETVDTLLDKLKTLIFGAIPTMNNWLLTAGLQLIMTLSVLRKTLVTSILSGILSTLIAIKAYSSEYARVGTEIVVIFLLSVMTTLEEWAPTLIERLISLLLTIVESISQAVDDNKQRLDELGDKVLELLYGNIKKWVDREIKEGGKLYTIGSNIIQGLINGVTGKLPFLNGLIDKMQNGTLSKFTKFWLINSPSKLMEKMGGYIMQGLGIGLEDGASNISSLMQNAGSKLLNMFTETVGEPSEILSQLGSGLLDGLKSASGIDFSSILGSFTNLNPVITPELDLSVLEDEAYGISSLFGNQQIGSISSDIGSWSTPQAGMDSITANAQIDSIMKKMEDYMNVQRYNQPTNINVVLDGDAKKMLKVLKVENNKQVKATGTSAI